MAGPYTHKKLTDVKDSAPEFGMEDVQEARFAKKDLEAEDTGVTHLRLKPGQRTPFGHRHEKAEEVYVVIGGSGRLKLDEEIIEVERLDAIRVPRALRCSRWVAVTTVTARWCPVGGATDHKPLCFS